MKRKFIRSVIVLIGILLLVFTIMTLADNWADFSRLELENPVALLLLLPLLFINIYATGRLFDAVLRPHDIHINGAESFGLASIGRFGNYVSFGQVGFALRAYYLKKKHSLKLSHALSGIGASNIAFYAVAIGLNLISIAFIDADSAVVRPLRAFAILFLLLMCLFIVIAWLISRATLQSSAGIVKHAVKAFSDSFGSVMWSRGVIPWSLLWSLVMLLSFTFMTMAEFYVLGHPLSVAQALFITSVASLNALINITPAGLGINEGLMIIAGNTLGLPPELVIASALIRRVFVFAFVTITSGYFSQKVFGTSLSKLMKDLRSRARREESA